MLTDADKNLSKVEILEFKEQILKVLRQPYFLEYADSPRSACRHFEDMINLPSKIKKLYDLIALHPEFEITDKEEESGHTLVTLAAENGYAYLMPHFAKFNINLAKPAPNGLTPLTAAKKRPQMEVIVKLEDMGIAP